MNTQNNTPYVIVIFALFSIATATHAGDEPTQASAYESACEALLKPLKPSPHNPVDLEITVSPRHPKGVLAVSYLSDSGDSWLRQDLLAGPIHNTRMQSTDLIWAATPTQSIIWQRKSDRFESKAIMLFPGSPALRTDISPNLKYIARLFSFDWHGDPNLTGVFAEVIPAEGGVLLDRGYFEGPLSLGQIEDVEINDDGIPILILRDGSRLLPKKRR